MSRASFRVALAPLLEAGEHGGRDEGFITRQAAAAERAVSLHVAMVCVCVCVCVCACVCVCVPRCVCVCLYV